MDFFKQFCYVKHALGDDMGHLLMSFFCDLVRWINFDPFSKLTISLFCRTTSALHGIRRTFPTCFFYDPVTHLLIGSHIVTFLSLALFGFAVLV